MNRILAFLALVSLPALAVAQAPSPTVTRVTDCAKLPDQAQRLACFDREVAELAKASAVAPAPVAAPGPRAPAVVATPAAPAAPASAPAPAAAPKSPGLLSRAKAAVGSVFTGSDSPPPAAAPVAAAPAARQAPSFGEDQLKRPIISPDKDPDGMLAARISQVRETRPDVFVFTLDNGQVWRQDEPRFGFAPQVEDAVTLRKGSLGSYRLNLDKDGSKNWIRVTRVR